MDSCGSWPAGWPWGPRASVPRPLGWSWRQFFDGMWQTWGWDCCRGRSRALSQITCSRGSQLPCPAGLQEASTEARVVRYPADSPRGTSPLGVSLEADPPALDDYTLR